MASPGPELTAKTRVAVVTGDPVTAHMAGPAIRAWHLAEELSRAGHDVVLASTHAVERVHPAFAVRRVDGAALVDLEAWWDVLVFQGGLLRLHPFLLDSEKPIVADVYDPFHLENLEQGRGRPSDDRHGEIEHLVSVIDEQLDRADFFLCASERQRDFWLGGLAARGRVNPATYDEDPRMRTLIDVVPFGVDAVPSPVVGDAPRVLRGVVPGISEDDDVLLWAGGVYNWFDPLTLLRAVDRLRSSRPRTRLFFLGMLHPNPDLPSMAMATEAKRLADELGLVGTHVFFNDGWVPYDERLAYLREADIGVSTHLEHVETNYAFRTRILDYLWAGLPVISTTGDYFADLIEHRGIGRTVAPQDVEGLTAALVLLLADAELRRSCAEAAERAATDLRWDRVVEPLLRFCDSPRVAPDRDRLLGHLRARIATDQMRGTASGWRGSGLLHRWRPRGSARS